MHAAEWVDMATPHCDTAATSLPAYCLFPLLGIGWGQSGILAFWGRIGGYRAIGGDIGKNGLRECPRLDDLGTTRLLIPPRIGVSQIG